MKDNISDGTPQHMRRFIKEHANLYFIIHDVMDILNDEQLLFLANNLGYSNERD